MILDVSLSVFCLVVVLLFHRSAHLACTWLLFKLQLSANNRHMCCFNSFICQLLSTSLQGQDVFICYYYTDYTVVFYICALKRRSTVNFTCFSVWWIICAQTEGESHHVVVPLVFNFRASGLNKLYSTKLCLPFWRCTVINIWEAVQEVAYCIFGGAWFQGGYYSMKPP